MYHLIKCSKNYRKTTGSLWNYYRDEPNNPTFKYKSSIVGKIPNNDNDVNNTKDVEIVVPLKYLCNFWRTLDICYWLILKRI